MKYISVILCGLLFSIGLHTAGMVNPNKVLNFLTYTEQWDPSLLIVLISALFVFSLGYHLIVKPKIISGKTPHYAPAFDLPTLKHIDKSLITGSIIFGLGWGIAGLCPGPAIANIGLADPKVYVFLIVMLFGMKIPDGLTFKRAR